MKLVTFRIDVEDRAGILLGDTILDLAGCFACTEWERGRRFQPYQVADRYGDGVLGFVKHQDDARPVADALVARFTEGKLPPHFNGQLLAVGTKDVTLKAPIPRPPSMRVGYAFRQHVETARRNRGLEMIPEFDQFPVFYFTNHQAVVGPGDLRVRPLQMERLDFELEAAIVIGREASDVSVEKADETIFGLTIMNDFSARVLQMEEMKLSLGPAKGKDFATGLGPYLVTKDELAANTKATPKGNQFDLGMRAFVNGIQVSTGNVKEMTWTFAQIVERASYGVTLYPGDVIGSGTCGTGCFLELNGSKITKDQWLKAGDTVALEIDGLGRLEHRIVAA